MLSSPNGDGDTTQLRMIMLLYRGIEGVHVDVYDLAHEDSLGKRAMGRGYQRSQ